MISFVFPFFAVETCNILYSLPGLLNAGCKSLNICRSTSNNNGKRCYLDTQQTALSASMSVSWQNTNCSSCFAPPLQCLCFSPSMDSSSDRDEPDQSVPAGIWLVPLFSAACFILFSLFCSHIFLPPLHWLLFPSRWLYAVNMPACVSTFSDVIPTPLVCVLWLACKTHRFTSLSPSSNLIMRAIGMPRLTSDAVPSLQSPE